MVQSGIGPGLDANLRPLYRAIIVLSLCLTIRAQNTTQGVEDVTCPQLGLASPTGSSPCRSLVRVLMTCAGTVPLILPINQQPLGLYGPPSGDDVTLDCECTDIVYNLFAGCAACQNSSTWYTRDQWFRPCPVNRPPRTIHSEEITAWTNYTYQPTFDVPTALAVEQGLAPPEPTATSSTVTSSGSVAGEGVSKHSSNNIGAIVGGVVGGVAFIAIVGFLIFFCIRKRKSRRIPPSAEFMKYAEAQGINNAAVPLTHMNQTEDDPRISHSHPGRNSIINLNNSTRSPSALGVSRNNTDEDAPPAFTTGLFKDPIFEKGVALNLAGAASASAASHGGPASASSTGHGPNPLTQTPVAYSPASTMFYPENQRLIHGRQMSS